MEQTPTRTDGPHTGGPVVVNDPEPAVSKLSSRGGHEAQLPTRDRNDPPHTHGSHMRAATSTRRQGWRGTVAAYVALTKPRVIELLLVTTVPAMFVAARGVPPLWLMIATTVGGALAAGSANAINCWFDRDIDAVMARTSNRPLVRSQITPDRALVFGVVLGIVAFAFMALTVNLLAAALATGANLFYVLVYTLGLKRRTTQNIVIGGAAGCVPVLVGWAAVTGTVELPALALFAIVFAWTPPHFWAIALRYRRDYERAGVPMMPVVMGVAETTLQMLLYTVLLVALSLMFGAVAQLGLIYLVSAIALGAGYIVSSYRLWRSPDAGGAYGSFRYSITYITLLFAAMAVDVVVPIGSTAV